MHPNLSPTVQSLRLQIDDRALSTTGSSELDERLQLRRYVVIDGNDDFVISFQGRSGTST